MSQLAHVCQQALHVQEQGLPEGSLDARSMRLPPPFRRSFV